MLKRLVAALTTAILALGLAVGASLPAAAHNANYDVSCSSLELDLVYYQGDKANYVSVTIDGVKVEDRTRFGSSFAKEYTWDPAVAHTYKIEVDAHGTTYDKTFTGTSTPCTTVTECLNPMSLLQGFTILTEGTTTVSNGGAHVTGTIAAGGDLKVTSQYHVANNEDGSAAPVIGGSTVGLLVGGKIELTASGEAFKVDTTGAAIRVGNTSGASASGNRYYPVASDTGRYVRLGTTQGLSDIAAPGLWDTTFSGVFASLRAQSAEIAAYTDADAHFVTPVANGGDGKKVTLVSGVTNVLRVSASELGSITKLWFATSVVPSASTPFIIDVTDAGSFNVTAPEIQNVDRHYVLWNFSKATSIGLYNNTLWTKGAILAPNAQLTLNTGGIEGQIAAKSFLVKSDKEIHHFGYSTCVPTDKPVTISTAPSAMPPTCDVDGKLVLPTIPNITWTGGVNGAGPGTYTVTAVPAAGYTLNGAQNTWTIVVKAKGDGLDCVKATEPTLTVATCDATTGALVSAYLTIPATPNLAYSMGGGAAFTAGQKVSLAPGTHVVDVVATNGYTNTGPSSFTITIDAFDCNKAVEPALTLAVCDSATNTLTPAFITIPTTTPGLEYRIAGVNGGAALSGQVPLAAGTYTVTVTAKPGYTNTGRSSFSIVVPAVTCQKAVEPTLTLATCHPTTGVFQTAFIAIPTTTPGLEYRIAGLNAGQPLSGTVNLPAGTYLVTVTAKAGFTNTGPGSFTVDVPALTCEKSVAPALTLAQCDAGTGAFTPAYLTIPTTTPGLEYRIAGINGGAPLSGQVQLAAGDYTVTVTAKPGVTNTGASSFPISVAALTCEEALTPTLDVAVCDIAGNVVSASVTAPTTTPGLTYTIRGGAVLTPGVKTDLPAGTYIVDVTAAPGTTNTGPSSFTIRIDAFDCNKAVEPKLTIAQCSPLTGPISAFVTIPTTTPGLIYSIGGVDYAAGDTVDLPAGPYQVDVRAAAGFANTGPATFTGTVAAVDCEGEDYVEPKVTPQTCDLVLGGTANGSLLFTLNADLEYWLDGVKVTTALVSDVTPGIHSITVVPAAGHYVKGGVDTFTVTVAAAVGCDNVYTTPLDPFASPEVCDPQSTGKLDGSITVVHVAGVQWFIGTKADGSDKVAVGDDTTVGNVTYAYPAGSYFVFAEAVDPNITIKPGHTVFPLTVDFPSQLCTLGFFDPSATAAPAVCNAAGDDRGTITVDLMPGVTYAFQGGAKITTATTKVAPGTYTVVATPDDPRSALSQDTWVLAVAAPSFLLCDLETLALTGQSSGGLWIAALILLQAGLALVGIRFVRLRRARHLAV